MWHVGVFEHGRLPKIASSIGKRQKYDNRSDFDKHLSKSAVRPLKLADLVDTFFIQRASQSWSIRIYSSNDWKCVSAAVPALVRRSTICRTTWVTMTVWTAWSWQRGRFSLAAVMKICSCGGPSAVPQGRCSGLTFLTRAAIGRSIAVSTVNLLPSGVIKHCNGKSPNPMEVS